MGAVQRILQFVDGLNDWIGKVFSFGALAMFILTMIEIVLRYFFNSPTVWTNELTQFIFGAYVMLSGGYILRWGGHVNVDILYSHLSTRRKALLDIFTFVLFFIFGAMMLWYGGSLAWESVKIWEHSESAWNPPVYPVKLMIPLGALLLILQGVAKLLRDIAVLAGGEEPQAPETAERETL